MDENRKHIIETETIAWLKSHEQDVLFSGRPPWECILHIGRVLGLPMKGELIGDAPEVMKYVYLTWKEYMEKEEKSLTLEEHLQRELAFLKEMLGEEHPDVVWVQGEIAKGDQGMCRDHDPLVHFRNIVRYVVRHYRLKTERKGAYFVSLRKRLLASAVTDQSLFERWLKDADISREQIEKIGMEDDGIPYFKWRELMRQIGLSVYNKKEVTWEALGLED